MSPHNIVIRSAEEEDLNQVYDFERLYIIEHEPGNLEKWDGVKEKTLGFLGQNLERMFVALVDKKAVGYGYWSMNEGQPCIYSIYVNEETRGAGLASLLMEAMEKQIAHEGHSWVVLSTLVTNPAQHLFSKLKYEEIKRDNGWIHYRKNIISV